MAEKPQEHDEEAMAKAHPGAASAFYNANKTEREAYLTRARRVSELTIPTLFRDEGDGGYTDQVVPWNSMGAYATFNLASKLVFALFPAGRPNFRAEQDARTKADLAQLGDEERAHVEAVIREGLSKIEQDTAKAIEEDGDRARMFVCALRLLVGGNHGFQFYPDGTIRGIPLERFVCVRDAAGNLLQWAVEDTLDWATLPEDVVAELNRQGVPEPPLPANGRRPVRVYTHGIFKRGTWRVRQEVLGVDVPGTAATYTANKLPYLFLPWVLLDGEHYGRSYVEFFEGELLTVEVLTKTISEGTGELAKLITLVNPTGLTKARALARAQNGDVIAGREQDVHVLTGQGKSVDFNAAQSLLEAAITRISRAFLLNSSIQRGGERVTAEEIRYVAGELEDALGGVYSQQIVTWQAPFIKLKLHYLQKTKRVTPVPENTVNITVTAGLASLARNAELTSLREAAAIIREALGEQAAVQFLKAQEFVSRVFAALGIEPLGLVVTEEEMQQQAQADQMQNLVGQLGPEAIKQVGQNITSNQVAETSAAARAAPPPPAPPAQ